MENNRPSPDSSLRYDPSVDTLDAPTSVMSSDEFGVPFNGQNGGGGVHIQGAPKHPGGGTFVARRLKLATHKSVIVSLLITFVVVSMSGLTVITQSRQHAIENSAALNNVTTQDAQLQKAAKSVAAPEFEGTAQSLLVDGDIISRVT